MNKEEKLGKLARLKRLIKLETGWTLVGKPGSGGNNGHKDTLARKNRKKNAHMNRLARLNRTLAALEAANG